VAPLGLVFYNGTNLPAHYHGGAFIGEHGSWNRSEPNGYKIVFVPFANGRPAGLPEDVVTGFLENGNKARGRPVGLAVDAHGALLIADDAGDTVWRVSASSP
jgi:glucose/arabinose dehydrogenase